MLGHTPYLLEAKWHTKKIGVEELHKFHSKLIGRPDWARGLFVSYSGFASGSLEAISSGRPAKFVCMNGTDIEQCLKNRMNLKTIIEEKVRYSAETNSPFVPVEDLRL